MKYYVYLFSFLMIISACTKNIASDIPSEPVLTATNSPTITPTVTRTPNSYFVTVSYKAAIEDDYKLSGSPRVTKNGVTIDYPDIHNQGFVEGEFSFFANSGDLIYYEVGIFTNADIGKTTKFIDIPGIILGQNINTGIYNIMTLYDMCSGVSKKFCDPEYYSNTISANFVWIVMDRHAVMP